MFGYNPYGYKYGYGLLSQMPMQQAPQIVQQPILSATRGIGTSLPDYRQMSMGNYLVNLLNQQYPQSSLINIAARTGLLGRIGDTLPQEIKGDMLQKIRSMSPEEYEKFAVYR